MSTPSATDAIETGSGDRTAARSGTAPGRARQRRPWLWFLLPFLVPFVLFYLLPIGYAVYQSLFKIQRTGGLFGKSEQVFAGFAQYADVFADETFRQGVLRVLLFGIVQVPVMLGLA